LQEGEGEGGEAGSEERLAPYLAALSGDQTDMTRENVFVFVFVQPPKGDDAGATQGTVLSLPRGSRVLDAIRAAEKWSSVLTASSGRNGRVVLRNGRRFGTVGQWRCGEHTAGGSRGQYSWRR
jgi:hypothetical protein